MNNRFLKCAHFLARHFNAIFVNQGDYWEPARVDTVLCWINPQDLFLSVVNKTSFDNLTGCDYYHQTDDNA